MPGQMLGKGRALAGSRGFRGKDASLSAGSRLDSHEIRGLCFPYLITNMGYLLVMLKRGRLL